jgi:L-iditol 2-dehydrogenase
VLAVTVRSDGSPDLCELPVPPTPPDGVLVRVLACGLCGSDVEKLARGEAGAGTVLGHELTGEVVDGSLPVGTRVALAHHVPCGACALCLGGHEPLCPSFVASRLEPGGFCELTAASREHVEHALLPLADGVGDLAATLVEPLACVLRGIEQLPDGPVLIAGAGTIGLLAAKALRLQGAEVRVLETDAARARFAAQLGCEAPQPGERFAGAFLTAAGAFSAACDLLAPAGRIVVFAGGGPQLVDLDAVYRRELSIVGARSSTPRHLRAALALIESGAIEVDPLIDCVLPLDAFADGLARYRERRVRKVVFRP